MRCATYPIEPSIIIEVPANGYPFLTENGDLIQEREAIGFPCAGPRKVGCGYEDHNRI